MANKARVLVTRPAPQAAKLCAALESEGFTVHCQPLLELVAPLAMPARQRRQIQDLDQFRHIVFVSGNAVNFGMGWIEDLWPQLPVGVAWYAIGDATARLLRDYGVAAVTSDKAMTSESLLAISQLQEVSGDRVLIVKGEGGRTAIQSALTSRGAQVEVLECYRRQCPDLPAGALSSMLAQWQIDLVLISSGEGLCNFLTLLSPQETTKLLTVTLVVPSKRVAKMARDAGFMRVHTADNASDAAMQSAAENWCRASETIG